MNVWFVNWDDCTNQICFSLFFAGNFYSRVLLSLNYCHENGDSKSHLSCHYNSSRFLVCDEFSKTKLKQYTNWHCAQWWKNPNFHKWNRLKVFNSICKLMHFHTAWIWIWMTKRPSVTSDGNFSSYLIKRSGYGQLFPFPVGGNGNNTIYPHLFT